MVQPQNWGGGHTHDAHTSQDPPRAGKGGQWGWGRGLQGVCHTPPPQPCPHTGSVPSPTGGGLSCPVCPPPTPSHLDAVDVGPHVPAGVQIEDVDQRQRGAARGEGGGRHPPQHRPGRPPPAAPLRLPVPADRLEGEWGTQETSDLSPPPSPAVPAPVPALTPSQ